MGDQNHRIGLSQSVECLDKLGKISSFLRLDRDSHDGGHTELHGNDGMSVLGIGIGKRGRLQNVPVFEHEARV